MISLLAPGIIPRCWGCYGGREPTELGFLAFALERVVGLIIRAIAEPTVLKVSAPKSRLTSAAVRITLAPEVRHLTKVRLGVGGEARVARACSGRTEAVAVVDELLRVRRGDRPAEEPFRVCGRGSGEKKTHG